jgi:glycosyltransferase involved in cell wall biosynthesis
MSHKPRLLIVSGSFPEIRCGVSGHVRIIAEGAVHTGDYEVSVLTSDDPAVKSHLAQGYTVHPRIQVWCPTKALSICREILFLSPDVVHIQNPTVKYTGKRSLTMSAVGPLLKLKAPKVRLVVMQHDIAIGDPLLRFRYYPLFAAADAVVVSNSRDEQAIRAQGIYRHKLYRAPVSAHLALHPPSAEQKMRSRQALGIPTDAVCAVHFGYIHPLRNVDVLLRALAVLPKRLRDNHAHAAREHATRKVYGLILGGAFAGAEDYYEQCKSLARRLGLDRRVTWTGFATAEQIADGLAAADVFVNLPQRGADLRNTSILTGMLAHLPVVTTRNYRYYRDAELESLGCLCVHPRDPRAVADAICRYLVSPPSPEELARRVAILNPEKIWTRHIDINHRAYRGETP